MTMRNEIKFIILIFIALLVIVLAVGIGSVFITPYEVYKSIAEKLFGMQFSFPPNESNAVIVWNIRLPRALLSFLVGSMLSVSGVLTQSVLRNPLASSYTLGISSGAAVGASIAILFGLQFFGMLTLPFFGLIFGLFTVFLALVLAAKLDKNLGNVTIILVGMAFSMFANAAISFFMTFAGETAQQITFWQLGSFALKDWTHPALLFPVAVVGTLIVLFFSSEMDLMTFGEEQAKATGVNVRKVKWILLTISAVLTGFAVSVAGVIGFVDLFTPHMARRIFGSRHKMVIPAAAVMGGVFMTVCDLAARTLTAPVELPVGAVTSALGAPFFLYLYFRGKGGKKSA